jgi:hypothetical protein
MQNLSENHEEREELASQAEDLLGHYEAAKGNLAMFLMSLIAEGRKPDFPIIREALYEIEICIFHGAEMNGTPDHTDTAIAILDALEDFTCTPQVEEAIDEHFHTYIAKAKEACGR